VRFLKCGLGGTRTRDQRLKRPLLYRLSYQPNDGLFLISLLTLAQPNARRKLYDEKAWRKIFCRVLDARGGARCA
jgi:hypothetical protein